MNTNEQADWEAFQSGDVAALWRLVYDPPRSWRFVSFPGDFEIIGKSLVETIGAEQAALLEQARAIKDRAHLDATRVAIEAFVRGHPGDPTAISAALAYVHAENRLTKR